MLKVAFLVQWHPTSPQGLIGRWITESAKHGVEIRCFTGIPWDDNGSGFAAHVRKPEDQDDELAGPGVVRYPYFHSHDSSGVRRFVTYGSFAARSSVSFRDLGWADVVLVYCSPATAVSAAMLARRFAGVPYVMMVQDVWPDSIFATGFVRSGPARRVARAAVGGFVSAAYRRAAAVTALSPGMRELLVSRGADPATAHVVYNWARQEVPVAPRVRAAGEALHLMYAGNMGPGQDLGNVLEAMARLPAGTARLTLVGGGADVARLRRLAAGLGPGAQVDFAGQVPMEAMPGVLAGADLHLVSLADTEVFGITIPSKLQSLMAMGLPVLSSAPGEVGQIVADTGCGIAAAPGDPAALAEAILGAAAMPPADLAAMGARGADAYYADMSLHIGSAKLAGILTQAAGQAQRPRPQSRRSHLGQSQPGTSAPREPAHGRW